MDSSSRDQERKNFSVKQITRRVQASYAIEQQKQKKSLMISDYQLVISRFVNEETSLLLHVMSGETKSHAV